MSETDEAVFLRHMLDAMHRIERYLTDVSREEFRSSDLLQDAVVRQLEILGEAAGRISEDTSETHPEIPWRLITGMRHRLIHGYFEVDLDLVWNVATAEIQKLEPRIQDLLEELE